MKKNSQSSWLKLSRLIFLGLLGYMPVHIFLSTWFGTSFGVLEVARVAKDGVLLVGAGLVLIPAIQTGVVKRLVRDKLLWIIVAFVLLNIVLALTRQTDLDAEFLGLTYNVRFLIFFVWAWLLATLDNTGSLLRTSCKVVLAVGAAVVAFGLFQYVVLPDDTLKHLGYARPNGVLPAFFIDDKPDLERIMSTVRDPNSLGSYLLIILGLSSARFLTELRTQRKVQFGVLGAATALAIFWTFSRAAWIGAVVTVAAVVVLSAARNIGRIRRYKVPILFGITTLLVVCVGLMAAFWNSYLVQNVVLHADQSTVLEDPNELRLRFWQESVEDVLVEPLGSGPGTAGLASIRNDTKTVLNENYYFQMAQELGIAGFVLFIGILVLVAKRLLTQVARKNQVAVAVLASFFGLLVTNFLAHIWANEAVAYTWWGLAGLLLAVPRNSHNKQGG
jgi:hypothetical protein